MDWQYYLLWFLVIIIAGIAFYSGWQVRKTLIKKAGRDAKMVIFLANDNPSRLISDFIDDGSLDSTHELIIIRRNSNEMTVHSDKGIDASRARANILEALELVEYG